MGVGVRAGVGMGVGGCGQVLADMGKGWQNWQVWIGQTDRAGMDDMDSG